MKRIGVGVVGLLLAVGLSPGLAGAGEPAGLWASSPMSEADLAAQSGRQGVQVVGSDQVVGVADSKADIKNNTLGDIDRIGGVEGITVENNRGITTNMINTGPYSNMVNTNSVTVNFINVAPNGQ